jgi:nitrate/nitrite-specific signal transduction histidine kinase
LPLLSTYLDQIAQKAFRVRQKAYYVALEKQVLKRSDEIRDATERLEALSEVTDRLQKENNAVSPCDWVLSRALDKTSYQEAELYLTTARRITSFLVTIARHS